MPHKLQHFLLLLMETGAIPVLCEPERLLLPLIVFGGSSLHHSCFFHMHELISTLSWILKGILCRSPAFSLCASLLSLVLCHVNSWSFNLPGLLASDQLEETAELHSGFPSLYHSLETVSRQWGWGNCRTHVVCLSSLRNHCFSLSDVQYLENHCFTYFVLLFTYFRQEGKSNHHHSVIARTKGPQNC